MGRRVYFGYAKDWRAAIEKYNHEREDLYSGRTPKPRGDGLLLKHVLNQFLTSKQNLVDSGELSPRTWRDYKDTCDGLVAAFGATKPIVDLDAEDFERLRRDIARGRGAIAIGNQVQRVRSVFRYAYEAGLIDSPIRFGPSFKRPTKTAVRRERLQKHEKMFSVEEIHQLLAVAGKQLRGMILLGINCAYGNADCGTLPLSAIELATGWAAYPRPKTLVPRRCPLWPETIEAIRDAIAHRPTPKEDTKSDLLFVTKQGKSWHKKTPDNPVAKQMRKLLDSVGIRRKGVGFYSMRHTFRTVADETLDFPAIDLIMGHSRNDMASHYRQRIDERVDSLFAYLSGTAPEGTKLHIDGWLDSFRAGLNMLRRQIVSTLSRDDKAVLTVLQLEETELIIAEIMARIPEVNSTANASKNKVRMALQRLISRGFVEQVGERKGYRARVVSGKDLT